MASSNHSIHHLIPNVYVEAFTKFLQSVRAKPEILVRFDIWVAKTRVAPPPSLISKVIVQKKPRDPNLPKRPTCSFLFFARDYRKIVVKVEGKCWQKGLDLLARCGEN